MGPAKRLPAPSQVFRVTNTQTTPLHQQLSASSGSSPAAISQCAAVTVGCSSAAAVKSMSDGNSVNQTNQQTSSPSGLHTSSLAPSTVPSSAASTSSATSKCYSTHPKPQLSTPAAAVHTKFGRTSKYATKDSPRTLGVKCVVDFERIYRYLSVIHKPSHECHLTPMGQ